MKKLLITTAIITVFTAQNTIAQPQGGPQGNHPKPTFINGCLDTSAIPDDIKTKIMELDSNKDNCITEQELEAGRPQGNPQGGEGKPPFVNGCLDTSKIPDQIKAKIMNADTNSDGCITEEEAKAIGPQGGHQGGKGKGGKGPKQ